jgi:hypothetical protein
MMKYLILTLLAFLFAPAAARAQVVISEILPNPESAYSQAEWIELYNSGDNSVDLKGWSLAGKLIPNNANIPGRGYLVFTKNLTQFQAGFITTFLGIYLLGFTLANGGGSIGLKNGHGQLVDEVVYANSSAMRNRSWERAGITSPQVLPHCYGYTLGQQNYNWNNNTAQPKCPQIIYSTTKGNWQPTLDALTSQAVNISLSEIANGDSVMWNINDDQYTDAVVTIPFGSSFNKTITANLSTPTGSVLVTSDQLRIVPRIAINEIKYTENQLALEFHNPDILDFELTNWQVIINDSQTFNINKTIADKGLELITIPVALAAQSINLKLVSTNKLLVDQVNLDLSVSRTWSKMQEGWKAMAESLGKENGELTTSTLQISEVFPAPATGESEWVEFYNFGEAVVDLSNHRLCDSSKCTILSGTVAAGEYYLLIDPAISLNNSGELLQVFWDQRLIDEFAYGETTKAHSQQRILKSGKYINPVVSTKAATPGKINIVQPTASLPQSTIKAAIAKADNTQLVISGHVTVPLNHWESSSLYIQDGTAGIKVKLSNASKQYELGAKLTIAGTVQQTSQGAYFSAEEKDAAIAEKRTIDAELLTANEDLFIGKLVKLSGRISKVYSTSFDLVTEATTLRITRQKLTALGAIEVGDEISLQGILEQQDEIWSIRPRFESDIFPISAVIPIAGGKTEVLPTNTAVNIEPRIQIPELRATLPSLPSRISIQLWQIAAAILLLSSTCYRLLRRKKLESDHETKLYRSSIVNASVN